MAEGIELLKQDKQVFADKVAEQISCGKFETSCKCGKPHELIQAFEFISAADANLEAEQLTELNDNAQAASLLLASIK